MVLALQPGDLKSRLSLDITNLKAIRKMLELSGEAGGLIIKSDSDNPELLYIVGVGKEKTKASKRIEFSGFMKWKLKVQEAELYGVTDGRICLSCLDVEKNSGSEIQNHIPEEILKALKKIEGIHEHGTSLVFMKQDVLEFEINRLGPLHRAYKIEPFKITLSENDEMLKGITAMDGAILLNDQGECHAIGAILDGEAVITGDPGRGARYNSLNNYVHWVRKKYSDRISKNSDCYAVVMSEDRDVRYI